MAGEATYTQRSAGPASRLKLAQFLGPTALPADDMGRDQRSGKGTLGSLGGAERPEVAPKDPLKAGEVRTQVSSG